MLQEEWFKMVEENILQAQAFMPHWKRIVDENPAVLEKIHWRSGSNGIQIISHTQERPMNGGIFIKQPKNKTYQYIKEKIRGILSGDLSALNIKGQKEAEHKLQAKFIQDLLNPFDKGVAVNFLQNILGADDLIFGGSEVVLQEQDPSSIFNKKKIIDVVAVSYQKIYIIEMKTLDNYQDNPVTQGNEYVNYYGSDNVKSAFCRIVSCYCGKDIPSDMPMELVILKGYKSDKIPCVTQNNPMTFAF